MSSFDFTGFSDDQKQRIRVLIEDHKLLERELLHRVKNNFQVISSLINMERNAAEVPVLRETLERIQAQVICISQLYEQLLNSHQSELVDLTKFLNSTMNAASRPAASMDAPVHMESATEPFIIDATEATYLALAVIELIRNAIKHSTNPSDIKMGTSIGPQGFRVWIKNPVSSSRDNTPNAVPASGIGLKLIEGMISRVGAQLTLDKQSGWSWNILVPINTRK